MDGWRHPSIGMTSPSVSKSVSVVPLLFIGLICSLFVVTHRQSVTAGGARRSGQPRFLQPLIPPRRSDLMPHSFLASVIDRSNWMHINPANLTSEASRDYKSSLPKLQQPTSNSRKEQSG